MDNSNMDLNNQYQDDIPINIHLIKGNKSSFDDFMSKPVDSSASDNSENNTDNLKKDEGEGADLDRPVSVQKADEQGVESAGDDNPYKILASFARENGLLEYTDEEIKDVEFNDEFVVKKYAETLEKRVKDAITQLEANYPEEIKLLLENYREGVPIKELIESRSRMQELLSITDEELSRSKELQKEVIAAYLYEQNFSDEEIESRIEKYEDAGLLADESRYALKKLMDIEVKHQEKLKNDARAAREEYEQMVNKRIEEFKTRVMSKKEIFPGVEYTDEMKKKVIDAVIKPIHTVNGEKINLLTKAQSQDPDFWEKVAFMVVNNWDLSILYKKAATEQAKKLRGMLDNTSSVKSTLDINNIKRAIEKMKNSNKLS